MNEEKKWWLVRRKRERNEKNFRNKRKWKESVKKEI